MHFEIQLYDQVVAIATLWFKGKLLKSCWLLSVFKQSMQEAYGGFSSVIIWLLVMHSAQREIRERHHYSVDCIVAIYVGILLWKMTGFLWPAKNATRDRRLAVLEKIQGPLIQAAKDSDIDGVRELLRQVELDPQHIQKNKVSNRATWLFASATIVSSLTIVLLAFILTSDG